MSMSRNIAANYISQFYVAFVGIFLVPVYMRLMGAEAYGLVAFFVMLQAWFQLLDFGLTATISRETARYLGGGLDALALRRLMRSLEGCFWAIGIAAAAVMAFAAGGVADRWLNIRELPHREVELSLALMGLTVATRWVSGLYRGAMSGLERQVWLSMFNICVVTARFVGVVPVLLFVGPEPVNFFLYQTVVSVVELGVLLACSYAAVPLPKGASNRWSWAPMRSVLRFSSTVAFTSAVWVLVTQTDKLLLSKFLPLQDYGFFTAAVLVASSITMVNGPVTQALLPRITILSQKGDMAAVVSLYRQATQGIAAIAGSVSLVMAVFSRQILWVWTGDMTFATGYAPVLALYAIGNGFLALAAFPYYLQYAKGDLRLHLWGNVVFVLVLMPAIVLATARFGAIGAGVVWASTNILFFFAWTPIVHRRFVPGLHGRWLVEDVLKVLGLPVLAAPLLWFSRELPLDRMGWGILVLGSALTSMGLALWRSHALRSHLHPILLRLAGPVRRKAPIP